MASIHASNFVEVQFFMNQFSEVFPFSYVLFFFDNHFTVSFKTQYFKLLITFCIFFFLIFSKIYSLHEKSFAFYEFYILVLLSFLGMFLFISSNSLISLYLSLELMSLTFYIMAASKRYTTFSTEASLKYFILSSLASCIILYGMSLVYGFSGLIYFDDLKIFLDQSLLFSGYDKFLHFYVFDYYGPNDIDYLNLDSGFLLGLILITIGFLFKIGAAPFHVWVPDVYEGAPLPVTLFFAILPKIVFAFFFLNFLNNIIFVEAFSSTYLKPFAFIFLFCGVLSFFVGSFGALYQSKIKRLLAFSAISNVGFFCFSFLLSSFYGSFVEIIFGLFVFIISYVFLTFLIFFLILNLRRYNNNIEVKKILDLENLFKINPAFSIIFALSFFSLAGIPPLLGFFGKFFILSPLVEYNFYFIALFILVFSVISSFYYIRIIKIIFFSKKNTWTFFKPISRSSSFILVFFSFFNIFFVLNPSFFLEFLYKVALVFCL
jgi:NADH-quinone oxidoreductase subunit N